VGVSRSPAELRRKLDRLADDYDDLPLALVKDGSLVVKRAVTRRAPARLSGVGKRGAKIGVRYNVGNYGGTPQSLIHATGPFHLIERDTKAHRIPKERGLRARKRYAVIPGVGVRAYAKHPGTQGQFPWAKGVRESLPIVRRMLESKAAHALRRIF
jgi:hypothetical protein